MGSPLLANSSLHALDACRERKKPEVDQGKGRKSSTKWSNIPFDVPYDRQRRDALTGASDPTASRQGERDKRKLRELSERQQPLPASDPLDANDRSLCSPRYADEDLIGIMGCTPEAERLFTAMKHCRHTTLQLDIAEEKSGIHHAKEGTACLGEGVQNFTRAKTVTMHREASTKVVATRRTGKERGQLRVPHAQRRACCQRQGEGPYEACPPSARPGWGQMDEAAILRA